jgi:hypothetical protein
LRICAVHAVDLGAEGIEDLMRVCRRALPGYRARKHSSCQQECRYSHSRPQGAVRGAVLDG